MSQKKQMPITFEDAMKQLESIVENMESETMALEELIHNYEKAIELKNLCEKHIESAQKKIEIIRSKELTNKPKEKQAKTDEDVRLL